MVGKNDEDRFALGENERYSKDVAQRLFPDCKNLNVKQHGHMANCISGENGHTFDTRYICNKIKSVNAVHMWNTPTLPTFHVRPKKDRKTNVKTEKKKYRKKLFYTSSNT